MPVEDTAVTTAICLFRPREGARDEVLELVLPLVEPSRREPGNVGYDWYQEPDGVLVLVESWATREAFEVHCAQPRVVEVFEQSIGALLAEAPTVHVTNHLTPAH